MKKIKIVRDEAHIRNLLIAASLCVVVLIVSTYAWFIGLQTVTVSSFDIQIAAVDSLSLSLDGVRWSGTVEINKSNYKTVSLMNNTNSWAEKGLVPLSSIGQLDHGSSRMKLFEKASLTATAGGYRLMASRVPNTGAKEADGYVAFDLFVKNMSGSSYFQNLDIKDEEGVYMSYDSEVGVASTGVTNTGIENSVRVAFAQIGRVVASTTSQSAITGITCNNQTIDGVYVTGVCRDAVIWEPNDTRHNENAIKWYNSSCYKRIGLDVSSDSSYDKNVKCRVIKDNEYYPTFAIGDEIKSSDNLDVYDGYYNYYTTPTSKIKKLKYFTDTNKMEDSVERTEVFKVAPNSITKVRVYVYIEGQDIDNYDFAQIGKKIAINFGFTKERFDPEDIEYTGPTFTPGE